MRRIHAASTALLALAGCGGLGVKVTPIGPEAAFAPRPDGCAVEFLQKRPARPHDDLAELTTHLTVIPEAGPLEALREPACRLGADAVVVTRRFVINELGHTLVAGVAIRYRAEPPAAAETPPSGAGGADHAPAGPSSQ
jgi:hypothetical protein